MGQWERRDFQRIYGKRRVRLPPEDGIGLRTCQRHDGPRDCIQPRRAVDGQRLGAVQTAQRLQKPGQTQNVVPVVVGQQHGRKPVRADAVPPQPDLRALAAVEQNAAPGHRHSGGRQRTVGQRLRAARTQKRYLQHRLTSFQQYPIIKRIIAQIREEYNRRMPSPFWGKVPEAPTEGG